MIIESSWLAMSVLSILGVSVVACCGCADQQQQQQISVLSDTAEEKKRVCPECGLENPKEANHCGDCGFSFKK